MSVLCPQQGPMESGPRVPCWPCLPGFSPCSLCSSHTGFLCLWGTRPYSSLRAFSPVVLSAGIPFSQIHTENLLSSLTHLYSVSLSRPEGWALTIRFKMIKSPFPLSPFIHKFILPTIIMLIIIIAAIFPVLRICQNHILIYLMLTMVL